MHFAFIFHSDEIQYSMKKDVGTQLIQLRIQAPYFVNIVV